MLQVTSAAQEKIKEVLTQEEELKSAHVRIYVSGVGWGGPKYGLTLDESIQEEKDIVEEKGAIKFVFDKDIAGYLKGKMIDFHDGPGGGFSINEPNPRGQCDSGCC